AVTARPVSASSRAAASARSSGVCCSTMKISHFHNLVTFVSRFHVTTSGKKKQHHRKNYGAQGATPHHPRDRSEEHTSELQSRFDLVCRLLLEKKNRLIKGPPSPTGHRGGHR